MTAIVRYMLGMAMVLALDDSSDGRRQGDHRPRRLRLDVGPDRRQAEAGDRPRDAAQRAAVDAGRSRARLHGLRPSREGQLRRHRADRPAGRRHRERDHHCRRQSEIPRQDAADRRRQAGRRSAQIHRGQGDRHPHHRRARDLQCRPLRARQGARAVRRRFHRPCRRLRADGGRGQAGRLPRREHRRQIHPGRRRQAGWRTRWSRPSSRPRRRRRRNPPRRPSRKSRNSISCRPSCSPRAAIRSRTATPG